MESFLLLVLTFGLIGHTCWAVNITTFEIEQTNGVLNTSLVLKSFNETTTEDVNNNTEATTIRLNSTTSKVNTQNATKSNKTITGSKEKANFSGIMKIFDPAFWSNLLGIFSGNVKVGIHGDLSNVASGNLESRGSLGLSVNDQSISVGGKFGIGGNLGQGLSNTGSIGAGGKIMAKPSVHFKKPSISLGSVPANGKLQEMNSKGGNGNWQNIKQYMKFFVDRT